MAEAEDFFSTYYAPENLTAALVGNFDRRRGQGARREVLRPHPARRQAGARRRHARGEAARREADERRVRLPAAGLGAVPHRALRAQGPVRARRAAGPAQRPDRAAQQEPGARPADRLLGLRQPGVAALERLVLPLGRDQGRRDAGGARGGALGGARQAEERADPGRGAREGQEPDRRRRLPPARESVLPDAAAPVLRRLGRLEVPERVGGRRRSR